ncbi:alkaline phosphatase D family protein [Legionella quinlivanii]|nr:alkaline phosphatase D family protein [Legionella quinlivanii]
MGEPRVPQIKNLLFGELEYIDLGPEEPAIEDDRVSCSIAIRLNKKYPCDDFQIRLTPTNPFSEESEKVFSAHNADSISLDRKKGKFLHFHLDELTCKTNYRYELLYKGTPLAINGTAGTAARREIVIRTPPARQDPQPVKIAVGGDQERHEQFGALGHCFDLDNASHTQLLYQHIADEGNFEASAEDDIESQPYQMMIHLGDLFNGEFFFSWRNLFRRGRSVFEVGVDSLKAFRQHLASDFGKPAGNGLAHLAYGVYAVADDHDTGQNKAKPPVTPSEYRRRENMEKAFHEMLLMPGFLSQPRDENNPDGPIGRAGPYYKKRVGQSEFFFLHNRYTNSAKNADAWLLGEEQWQWLEQSLANSKASNKVLISPLPLVMGKDPGEDYRAHWQEWQRLMQLCRNHRIATILTADSHNYSCSELHVRAHHDDEPWVVHQHLVGTLGGSKQYVSDEELQCINSPGRPPLLPKGEGFDASLYEGSRVTAYFSPGNREALLPDRTSETKKESQWTAKGQWQNNTHAYASLVFKPAHEAIKRPSSGSEGDSIEMVWQKNSAAVSSWQVHSSLFTCSDKRNEVVHEPRLDCDYSVTWSV